MSVCDLQVTISILLRKLLNGSNNLDLKNIANYKNWMKIKYSIAILLLTLSSYSNSQSISKPHPYGKLTPIELDLIGEDKNNNGLRDDIDAWVLKSFLREETKDAVALHARWLTFAMLQGYRKIKPSYGEVLLFTNIAACEFRYANEDSGDAIFVNKKLFALLFDNSVRNQSYLAWNSSRERIMIDLAKPPCKYAAEPPKL